MKGGCYYGLQKTFQRSDLPEDVDKDNIKAVYKNSIMNITIPRKAAPKSEIKQIEIKTN